MASIMGECLWLDQSPFEHAALLHGEAGKGRVTIGSHDHNGNWHDHSVDFADIPAAVCQLRGHRDTYITYNRFWGRRRLVQNLKAICAAFADLDFYKLPIGNPLRTASPEHVAEQARLTLKAVGLPAPSVVTFTGRGLALAWLLEPVSAGALPRWFRCQRELYKVLQPFGADPMALDAARMTRLAGTINSKSRQPVRILECGTESVLNFEVFAEKVLPFKRAELKAIRAERAARWRERRGRRGKVRPSHRRDPGTLHDALLRDLGKLWKGRFGDAPPRGQRNAFMFFSSCSLAWLVPPGAPLRREIITLGNTVGWSPAETKSRMSAVMNRAEAAGRDGTAQRYRHKASTIIEKLGITEEEIREFDLRCLVTPQITRERDAARKLNERRQAGSKPREAYLNTCRQVRQKALDLAAVGFSAAKIGEVLGKSKAAVKMLLSRARQEGLEPTSIAANTNETLDKTGGNKSVQVNGGNALPPSRNAFRGTPKPNISSRKWISAYQIPPGQSQNQNSPHRGVQLDLFHDLEAAWPTAEWDGGHMPVVLRQRVWAAMRASGVTQSELALAIGISRGQVGNILTGRFGTRPEVAERFIAWVERAVAAA